MAALGAKELDDEGIRMSMEPPESAAYSPEQALGMAVVYFAIHDAVGQLAPQDRHHRRQAIAWLFSDSTVPLSFVWWAEHVCDAPDRFIAQVRAFVSAGRGLGHMRKTQ